MSEHHKIDGERLTLILHVLRFSTIELAGLDLAAHADREAWPAERFPEHLPSPRLPNATVAADRHLAEACLPPGKSLDSFAFDPVTDGL